MWAWQGSALARPTVELLCKHGKWLAATYIYTMLQHIHNVHLILVHSLQLESGRAERVGRWREAQCVESHTQPQSLCLSVSPHYKPHYWWYGMHQDLCGDTCGDTLYIAIYTLCQLPKQTYT